MTKKGFSIGARIQSFGHALRGIAVMFRTQHNSWIHLLAVVSVILLGWCVNLSADEWIYISLAIGLVLVAELANTGIEFLGDAISAERNEDLRNAKDAAAGAVLVAAGIAVIVACLVFVPKLIALFQIEVPN
ncbi:MAG: diacylglycerol kinase family protein [Flavobacteriales bacterium]|nr:diacylglycerol kinase family protein [Flavobacteriales bacterium]